MEGGDYRNYIERGKIQGELFKQGVGFFGGRDRSQWKVPLPSEKNPWSLEAWGQCNEKRKEGGGQSPWLIGNEKRVLLSQGEI